MAPLFFFLVVFGATCFLLDFTGVLLFTHPGVFWLSALLPWFWWMQENGYSGLYGLRGLTALMLRLSIAGVFIMLLAEPRAVRESKGLSVVYALDISDSIAGEAANKSLEFVLSTAQKKPEGDKAGLVVFGGNAAVELPPRTSFPFEAVNSIVDKDDTNIEKALSLSAAMIPEDENGRIVLISDGNETSGTVKSVLDDLKARSIAVDVLPVQYDFKDEVWLEKLEVPVTVKEGETYEASVVLSSLNAGKGVLILTENGGQVFEKEVGFSPGKNRFSIPIYMRRPGYYEYVAKIQPPPGKDGWPNNNVAINYLYLQGKGKVLLLKDPSGDQRDWDTLSRVIRDSGREIEVADAMDCPRDLMSIHPYDCIIIANTSADCFDYVQMQAIKDAVYSQGAGLLMVGGGNSFGPGGYNRTPVEEALPVDMDITSKKVLPKGALAIILHTCEFPDGNTWAKRIAKASIKVLGEQDEAGLLAYDFQGGGAAEKWVFPMTPVSKYEEMVRHINSCEPGDMPSFANTMKLGLEGLKKSDAAAKHMIIISDGDPQPPQPDLVQSFINEKITVSTVLVDGYHQGSFQAVMQAIAKSTGGRFYYPQNPESLPSIFIKEAKTLKKSMIQNKTFVPTVEFDDGAVLKGIGAIRPVHGYVLTSVKEDSRRCTVILRGPDQDQVDPVLAVGRFGIGKSAVFTSDLSPNWCKDWMEWDMLEPFVKQLLVSISRVSKEQSLRLHAYASGSTGMITVEDFCPEESFLDISVKVAGPDDMGADLKLEQTAPRRYQGKFDLWGQGRYQIMAAGGDGKRNETATGGLIVPYSPEYLKFRSNPLLLERIVGSTGGRMLYGDEKGEKIFPEERKARRSSKPIFGLFLAMLAFLIPLDVGVRRVQMDFSSVTAYFRRTKVAAASSTETLGALLKRKEGARIKIDGDGRERPMTPHAGTHPPRQAKTPEPASAKKPQDPVAKQEAPEELSTTERLLAKKRKRDKKD